MQVKYELLMCEFHLSESFLRVDELEVVDEEFRVFFKFSGEGMNDLISFLEDAIPLGIVYEIYAGVEEVLLKLRKFLQVSKSG